MTMDMTPLFTFETGVVSGKNHAKGTPHSGKRIIVNGKLLCLRSKGHPDWTGSFTTNSPLKISWDECSFIGVDKKQKEYVFMKQGKLVNGFFLDDIA